MIGNNIHKLMKEQGLTQAQLAKLANISQASLSAIINGSSPRADTLSSLASALGVPVSELQSRTSAELRSCPRCGSAALVLWQSFAEPLFRLRCSFCGLDSGEHKSMDKVASIMESFRSNGESYHSTCVVLSLDSLLSSSGYGADDIRPVWFENRGLFVVPALLQCGTAEREQELCRVQWYGESMRSFLWSKYGLFWRVWSQKPSSGLVDSTQWNE